MRYIIRSPKDLTPYQLATIRRMLKVVDESPRMLLVEGELYDVARTIAGFPNLTVHEEKVYTL